MEEKNTYGRVGVCRMSSIGSKYTEDWITVKNITNGMIELDNGGKVTGVKIRPRNIFILDSNTRNNIIAMLKTFYDTIDFEFWMISADRPVDISSYLATLQIQYNQVQDPRIKKLISQDIEKANDFMRNNVTDTEYYILIKEKNYDEAILNYKKALSINPKYENAHLRLGNVYKFQNKTEEALKEYTNVLSYNPNSEDAYYNIGLCLLNEKKYPEAIEKFNKVVSLNEKYSLGYYCLGLCYEKTEKANEALENYQKFVSLTDDNGLKKIVNDKIKYLNQNKSL